MKYGRSLADLAQTLEAQLDTRKDFLVRTNSLTAQSVREQLQIGAGEYTWGMGTIAHENLSSLTGIPKQYYDRLLAQNPELLANNVNQWLPGIGGKRLVRSLEGRARALLSERYRPIDNYDLAEAALPSIEEAGAEVKSCELTERRMYLKATFPKLEGEINTGDVVQAGIMISNSEVGCGSVSIRPMVYRLVCRNGLISEDHSLRRHHIGRIGGGDDGLARLLSPETLSAENKAFMMKVRDVVQRTLTQEVFQLMTEKLREAAGHKITRDPVQAVESFSETFGLSKGERGGVLRHLVEGGDLSQWGLTNAVTRYSQDVDNYDRATELEKVGGKVIELEPSEWKVIAEERD